MPTLNIRQYRYGAVISLCIALAMLWVSFSMGKNEFFLLLNGNLGSIADYFFAIFTNAGDASLWIVALLITLFVLKQKKLWPLLLSGFVISTILTQACKYFIFPNELRPYKAIPAKAAIHHVLFVQPLNLSSFPSGHTATAFSIYLVFCLLLPGRWWLWVGLLYGLLVGYSRVYLAQHFPLDVAAGIIVGVVTVVASLYIQKVICRKQQAGKPAL